MTLTTEDKRMIAEYMPYWKVCYGYYGYNQPLIVDSKGNIHHLDLNDAGECFRAMEVKEEDRDFIEFVFSRLHFHTRRHAFAYLFNADNFWQAFVEWRKQCPK